jgi:acyl-CoA thioesterase-1
MNSTSCRPACSARPTTQVGIFFGLINLMSALAALFTVANAHAGTRAVTDEIRIVAFGDSLTAGYGLKPGQAFPDVLQMALRARGHHVEVINSGVSGDTTAAGLARLDWAVGDDADAVILELGANDALRGQPPKETRANLDTILTKLGARRLPVLIAGMRAPENWGSDYRDKFDVIFGELAAKHAALLYPFFLAGVATDPKLNLSDGLHPNARGIGIIVERILPKVEALIDRAKQARSATATSSGQR